MRSLSCFFLLTLFLLPVEITFSQNIRSFSDIFPVLPSADREAAFSVDGYSKSSEKQPSTPAYPVGNIRAMESALDPRIIEKVMEKNPGFLAESILVLSAAQGEYSLLDVYNAIGKVSDLKGRVYHSHTRNEYVPLFEDVTRIESARRNNPIADPAPASRIPASETVYMRLKDVNFGNTYYRGDMALVQRGLDYSLTNYRNMTYFLIPVIREEKFIAQLYFEPIAEGIMIYALAGADVSNFVSSKIDMTSAISKRLAVIVSWIADGITGNNTL
jgi:hypothetical protein